MNLPTAHNYVLQNLIDNLISLEANFLKPNILIANTIKGKGFNFSENNNEWHHSVMTKSTYEKALTELRYSLIERIRF